MLTGFENSNVNPKKVVSSVHDMYSKLYAKSAPKALYNTELVGDKVVLL